MALEYFAFNNWKFINDKFMALNQKIPRDDMSEFYFFHEHVHLYNYYKMGMLNGAKYLLGANVDDDRQRRAQRRYIETLLLYYLAFTKDNKFHSRMKIFIVLSYF